MLVPQRLQERHCVERAFCHCSRSQQLGTLLVAKEGAFPLRQPVCLSVISVCQSPEIMALVRMVYFCATKFDINVMIVHIAGSNNMIADGLSRFQATCFHQLAPLAAPHPDNILAWPTQFWMDFSMNINP